VHKGGRTSTCFTGGGKNPKPNTLQQNWTVMVVVMVVVVMATVLVNVAVEGGPTFSRKVRHSCAVSSSTLSWPRATLRSRVHRCHTVVMERLMVALLASLPTSSS